MFCNSNTYKCDFCCGVFVCFLVYLVNWDTYHYRRKSSTKQTKKMHSLKKKKMYFMHMYTLHQCVLYIPQLPGQKVCLSDFNYGWQLGHKTLLSWLVSSSRNSIFWKEYLNVVCMEKHFHLQSQMTRQYDISGKTLYQMENPNERILF